MSESSIREWPDPNLLMFRRVDRKWDASQLMSQKGWFPLADVMKLLDPKSTGKYRKILALREKAIKDGTHCSSEMGLKQYGSRIWADMPVFSQWYLHNELLRVHRIPKSWDLQTFLRQETGIFSLKGALQLLPAEWPIKYHAMKTMIQKRKNPRAEIGADKLEGSNYVVFMPKFGEWLLKQLS